MRDQNDNFKDNFVVGRNSVLELLKAAPSRIKELFLAKTFEKEDSEIVKIARKNSISISFCNPNTITAKTEIDSHQGCLAVVEKRKKIELEEIIKNTRDQNRSLIVVLDSIEDPGNFGAILRASECFGADAVLFSRNRGASITPAVTKASVGASEIIPLVEVGNIVQSLEKLKKNNYWVVASDVNKDAKDINTFVFPEKTVLIIGAEGRGIQRLVLEKADFKVYIPLYGQIQSLNASQAATVFMSAYRRG